MLPEIQSKLTPCEAASFARAGITSIFTAPSELKGVKGACRTVLDGALRELTSEHTQTSSSKEYEQHHGIWDNENEAGANLVFTARNPLDKLKNHHF